MRAWIEKLLADPDMLAMGHGQRSSDQNLGLGWIYYGLVRALRTRRAVVIGSWRGFVPLVLGRAMLDNQEGGEVIFIDPSLVDDFWIEPARVTAHFGKFDVTNIRHILATTQDFATTDEYRRLEQIGLLFVDGLHTFEQAKFDYETFASRLTDDAVVLFHDSTRYYTSTLYGADKPVEYRVKDLMTVLRQDPSLELLDLPIDSGVTLLRRRTAAS